MAKILIVEARFYNTIQDLLVAGATTVLQQASMTYDTITVNGALEIPAAVCFAENSNKYHYDGYICLGCVIRGDTTHYDYVCEHSFRGIMDLSIEKNLAISNGILTVENTQQALLRADKNKGDKGGAVAKACLKMIEIKKKFANH